MSPVKVSGLNKIAACLRETAKIHEDLAGAYADRIFRAASLIIQAIRSGHKIIWFGNGGSASQAQHMAAELVGRFAKERRAFASISLSENMASVTAIANDYGYERLFVRQLEGLAKSGDVVVGLSTSGRSPNVLLALQQARKLGLKSIGLTGKQGIPMKNMCDVCIMVPSAVTARIQEAHLSIGHLLCNLAEVSLARIH
jgi:D-sedoheptulose 7-phosphate isomerase